MTHLSRTIVLALTLVCITSAAHSMSFKVNGDYIEASGELEPGDTSRFASFLRTIPVRDGYPAVALSSPGGNLAEGLELGRYFRKAGISTRVRRGAECYSACAIAFLGGTNSYTTGIAVGRKLEVGAKLGYHGFYAGDEKVVLLNQAFDLSRVLNGLVVSYAVEMSRIDIGLLSELMTVEPTGMTIIRTPRQIRGLGIEVVGALPPTPHGWARNLCERHINAARPLRDQMARMEANALPKSIKSRADLKAQMTDTAFAKLMVEYQPDFPAVQYETQRGAGFYYDNCFAFSTRSSPKVLLSILDGMNASPVMSHGPLGQYPDDSPLW